MFEHMSEIATWISVCGFFIVLFGLWKKQGNLEGSLTTTLEGHSRDIKQQGQRIYNLESERFMTHEEHEEDSRQCRADFLNQLSRLSDSVTKHMDRQDKYWDDYNKKHLFVQTSLARIEAKIESDNKSKQ